MLKRKGSVTVAIALVGTLMFGAVLSGVTSTLLDAAEDQNQGLQEQFNKFERHVTLSADPNQGTGDYNYGAKDQIRSLLHLNTLRGAHCRIMYSANSDENSFEYLEPAKEFDSLEDLPCQTQERKINLNIWENVLGSLTKDDILEEDGADQEGKYGSIDFTYPDDSNAPILIDSDDLFKEEGTGQIVSIGSDIPSGGLPIEWAGRYYRDRSWNGDSNVDPRGSDIFFQPDERLLKWLYTDPQNKQNIGSPPYDTDSYVTGSFNPVLLNVPVVNSTPLNQNGYSERKNGDISYKMIICPGSTGTIQANSGGPYSDGEATSKGDEKKMYPFLKLDRGSPTHCVEQYVLGEYASGEDSKWSAISGHDRIYRAKMKIGEEFEGTPPDESPCGPGRIKFKNDNGNDLQIEFDDSKYCKFTMAFNPGIGSEESNKYSFEPGETLIFEVREGNDPFIRVRDTGDDEAVFSDFSTENPVDINEIRFIGNHESPPKPNPDYFYGEIYDVNTDLASELGTISFFSPGSLDESPGETHSDPYWDNGEYIFELNQPGKHRVDVESPGNLKSIIEKETSLSCSSWNDATSDSTETFSTHGKDFEVKCGLNPINNLKEINMVNYENSTGADIMSVEFFVKEADN